MRGSELTTAFGPEMTGSKIVAHRSNYSFLVEFGRKKVVRTVLIVWVLVDIVKAFIEHFDKSDALIDEVDIELVL